jgi:hypothetical protein
MLTETGVAARHGSQQERQQDKDAVSAKPGTGSGVIASHHTSESQETGCALSKQSPFSFENPYSQERIWNRLSKRNLHPKLTINNCTMKPSLPGRIS